MSTPPDPLTQSDGAPAPDVVIHSSTFKSRRGLSRLFPALRYSLQGMKAAWQHEASFRQEVLAGSMGLVLSIWIAPSIVMWLLMAGSILMLWCVELLNSAIEALADAVSLERHPLLGRAKDLGSAAVFMTLLGTIVVWITAFILRFAG